MLGGLTNAFRNYAVFAGRASRTEFWSFMLLFAVVTVGAHFLDGLDGEISPVMGGMGMLELIAFIALLLPAITTGVRRLHDIGRSGWWLCFMYIPYVAFVAAAGNEQAMIASSGALLLGSIFLLIHFAMPGDRGENRFGPDPRGMPLG